MRQAKQLLQQMFYIPKHEKLSEKTFSRLLLFSVLGILLCGVCLGGLTWAWFSDSTVSSAEPLRAASFDVTAVIRTTDTGDTVSANDDQSYTLSAGHVYQVTLTPGGTASTGYCIITVNGQDYFTTQMKPKPEPVSSLQFKVDCRAATANVSFVPHWMTYSGYSETATNLIGQNVTTIQVPASAGSFSTFANVPASAGNDPASTGTANSSSANAAEQENASSRTDQPGNTAAASSAPDPATEETVSSQSEEQSSLPSGEEASSLPEEEGTTGTQK